MTPTDSNKSIYLCLMINIVTCNRITDVKQVNLISTLNESSDINMKNLTNII